MLYMGKRAPVMFEFRNVKGHIEVFLNGEFVLSADTYQEAKSELKEMEEEVG